MATISLPILDHTMNKFILITKPEQSGKTFIMIKQINHFLSDDYPTDNIVINFIFCDNSLLLTTQTKKRVGNDIMNLPGVEEPYVELSSRRDGCAKNSYADVILSIMKGCRNIICCTNSTRVHDINKIIHDVNDMKYLNKNFTFKIWLDEADKFCNYITKSFIPLTASNDNVNVYLITATSQRIFTRYGDMRVFPIENTTLPEYHGWTDNNIIIRDDESGTIIGFARQIADEMMYQGKFTPGCKCFVPAASNKKSHYAIRDMFIMKNVAVFVVNGDGIELSLPDNTCVKIEKKTHELHVNIKNLYHEYDVNRFSCVLTGNICIGRGISIMQPDFIFDYAIISNVHNKSEASQIAGRLKGNIKGWATYKKPSVYTTDKFNKVAIECELQSREIAQLAFEKAKNMSDQDVTPIITKNEAKLAGKDIEWKLYQQEFSTLNDVNKFLQFHGCRQKKKFRNITEDGFIRSTTTKKASILFYNDVIKEMEAWRKTATFDVKTNLVKYGRVFVCYKDLKDTKSIVYIVRVIEKV